MYECLTIFSGMHQNQFFVLIHLTQSPVIINAIAPQYIFLNNEKCMRETQIYCTNPIDYDDKQRIIKHDFLIFETTCFNNCGKADWFLQ